MIEVGKSRENLDIVDVFRGWPVDDSFHLLLIHFDLRSGSLASSLSFPLVLTTCKGSPAVHRKSVFQLYQIRGVWRLEMI